MTSCNSEELLVLGCDTAQSSLGLAVIGYASGEVCVRRLDRFCAVTDLPHSDFVINSMCIKRIREILEEYDVQVATAEAPIYSSKFGSVSIGTIHGVILQEFIDRRLPFIYSTPGKVKYFTAGHGKATKARVRKNTCEFLGIKKNMDFDKSDALAMSLMSGAFWWYLKHNTLGSDNPFVIEPKWAELVFKQRSPRGKNTKRRPGIIYRPFEFFWIPQENVLREDYLRLNVGE